MDLVKGREDFILKLEEIRCFVCEVYNFFVFIFYYGVFILF